MWYALLLENITSYVQCTLMSVFNLVIVDIDNTINWRLYNAMAYDEKLIIYNYT